MTYDAPSCSGTFHPSTTAGISWGKAEGQEQTGLLRRGCQSVSRNTNVYPQDAKDFKATQTPFSGTCP